MATETWAGAWERGGNEPPKGARAAPEVGLVGLEEGGERQRLKGFCDRARRAFVIDPEGVLLNCTLPS